jgi:hypothetical protein
MSAKVKEFSIKDLLGDFHGKITSDTILHSFMHLFIVK